MDSPVILAALWALSITVTATSAADLGTVPLYRTCEIRLNGPTLGPKDTPARDIELAVTFRHESGATVQVHGSFQVSGVFEDKAVCAAGPVWGRIAG